MKYIDNSGMMMETGYPDNGEGDALWRTSLAFICYPHLKDLLLGIHRCTVGEMLRHPETKRRDTSRDQVVMAIVAFHVNGYTLPVVKYRISDKFTMSDSWLWYKSIRDSRKAILWRIISFFTPWFMPAYALHIWSWMVYCIPNTPVLNWIGLLLCGDNLLLRQLHGAEVEIQYTPHNDFYWQRNNRGPVKQSDLKETPEERYPIDLIILYRV